MLMTFLGKCGCFTKSFDFLEYVDGKREYVLWGPTTHNVIVSQDVVMTLSDEGCVEENNSTLVEQIAL